MSLRYSGIVLLLAASASCDGGGLQLLVELKTDLVPGRQFVGVRTEIGDPVTTRDERISTSMDDYIAGERIAEADGLEAGTFPVVVTLLDAMGNPLASRTTLVTITTDYALTVLITSSCRETTCPEEGDPTDHTACVGGRCVDPRCSPETPDLCDALGCVSDAQCTSPVSCGTARCIDSECFVRLDDRACAPGFLCDPDADCIPDPRSDAGAMMSVDAGPTCPSSETSCADGLDDDCDGDVDCADSDCAGVSCDDESVCTDGDVCRSDGSCAGTAIDCDDSNPCTDDACDPTAGCTHGDNTASCDDGFWCNGPDVCAAGACTSHPTPPCPSFCNETTMACEACATDPDCGTPSTGAWSACGGFANTCDESGTRSRSVMTPRCVSGACTTETTMESETCSRTTAGDACGTTTYSSWSSCGGFANACDTTGTQTRTRTDRRCAAGACANQASTESRSCTRSVSNGTHCGSTMWHVCCSGSCTDTRNNASHCGACGVDCTSVGLSCASTGTGGYACRGCSSNAMCRTAYSSSATCYTTSASFCNCQCASDGVCAGAGCGSNFYCHDCPGQNFCSPQGGGC